MLQTDEVGLVMKDEILELADYLSCNGEELYSELRAMGLILDGKPITRFEVIDHTDSGQGRELVKYYESPIGVDLSVQDNNRTLKIFIKEDTQNEQHKENHQTSAVR